MSASTVSVTANPRRRTTIPDPKQTVDFLPTTDGPTADPTTNNDLSHSFRGGEKPHSNDTTPALPKKPPSRTRKIPTGPKHPKPRWKTLTSIVIKNVLLLVVLVGLVQMVRRLSVRSEVMGGSVVGGFTDMEGRIAAVETSLRTTAKMLQVQVEVVDRKVDGEVGNLRREVGRRVDKLGGELAELRARGDGVKELAARVEGVERLYREMKKVGKGVDWEEIRGVAREIVEKEIERHAADGLGRVDYALGSAGGRVVRHSEPVGKVGGWFAGGKDGVSVDAGKMLEPSFGEPAKCFALKGGSGFVEVRLRSPIVAEAVTLEHVAKSVAYDRSSAPKDCRVFGWHQGQQAFDTELTADSEKMLLLTEFTYDLEKSNAQTFNVLDSARSSVIDTVRFDFSSNHGNQFTCIYRLRVHGHEPNRIVAADA